MNIGIITSGGDAPGMNPCIAQIVKNAYTKGYTVFGYKYGYSGIRDNHFIELRPQDVQGWYKLGGTVLKTSRMPELKELKWQLKIIEQLNKNNIEVLIVLGGDGSFKGAEKLCRQNENLNIIGIPSTIDNNIFGSDYTLGYDTAINKQMSYIDDISDTAMAMPGRIFFVETLGADQGYLPYSSVMMGMADFSVLNEYPMTNEEICNQIKYYLYQEQREYILVTFAEGLHQMFDAADYVKEKLGIDVKCNLLGYQQRGGVPTAKDRLHAAAFAKYAIHAIENNIKNKYIVYKNGKYGYLEFNLARKRKEFNRE